MTQLHKRFTDGEAKVLLNGYRQGFPARGEISEMLGIAKTRFFGRLEEYRKGPEHASSHAVLSHPVAQLCRLYAGFP
ncbi:MAG: hypothetical protein MUQ10_16265, partial [Anaerolineae bacterium]|nr:hypothetical protein [Anaerolineae bacterium]